MFHNKVHPAGEALGEDAEQELQAVGPTPSIWASLKSILGSFKEQNEQEEHRLDAGLEGILSQENSRKVTRESLDDALNGGPSEAFSPNIGFGAQLDPHAFGIDGVEGVEQRADSWNNWKMFVKTWLKDGENAPNSNGPGQLEEEDSGRYFAPASVYGESAAPSRVGSFTSQRTDMTAATGVTDAHGQGPSGGSRQVKKSILVKSKSGHEDDVVSDMSSVKRQPSRKFTIKLPSIQTQHWDNIVHAVVWRVGRHFGFQAFNINPSTAQDGDCKEYVPASIFVASDHLTHLLCKNFFLRRDKGKDKNEERFAKAVFELHCTVFQSYEESWTKLTGLSWRLAPLQACMHNYAYNDGKVVNGLLSELALYFLIYTESANLRFCSELLWFVYWCMSHSFVMMELWQRELPENEGANRDRRVELRNKFQAVIRDVQNQLCIYTTRIRPEDCGRMSSILTRLAHTDVLEDDRFLVADLVAFGDGGFYCDRIVLPIFNCMAYEIDHLSNLGVEVAHRLGYDDFNESMCSRTVVQDTLRALRVKPEQLYHASPNDAYQALTNLGYTKHMLKDFDAQVASEFWRTRVFVKTYRERRTWWGPFRNYWRVIAFHIVLFHFLMCLAFVGWDWRLLSSTIITHSIMCALERIANWFMTVEFPEPLQTTLTRVLDKKGRPKMVDAQSLRALHNFEDVVAKGSSTERTFEAFAQVHRPQPRRKYDIEGYPVYGLVGLLEWIVLAFVTATWFIVQFIHTSWQEGLRIWWMWYAAAYTGLFVLHFILTTRDGYVISLSEALNLPWFMRASSAKPTPTNWIMGEMHMKWKLFFLNALFWVIVLCMKVPFDYFVLCAPVVDPVKLIFKRKWLACKTGYYFGKIPCVGGDWLLVVARIMPFIVIFFMDTSLFYQLTTTLFGIFRGMFKLDLGVLTDWDDVVKEFYRAPGRWWHKCMSEIGNENQLALLKQSMFVNEGTDGSAGAVISDGMMFKKSILTPEEIHSRKAVQFSGGGALPQAGSMEARQSVKSDGGVSNLSKAPSKRESKMLTPEASSGPANNTAAHINPMNGVTGDEENKGRSLWRNAFQRIKQEGGKKSALLPSAAKAAAMRGAFSKQASMARGAPHQGFNLVRDEAEGRKSMAAAVAGDDHTAGARQLQKIISQRLKGMGSGAEGAHTVAPQKSRIDVHASRQSSARSLRFSVPGDDDDDDDDDEEVLEPSRPQSDAGGRSAGPSVRPSEGGEGGDVPRPSSNNDSSAPAPSGNNDSSAPGPSSTATAVAEGRYSPTMGRHHPFGVPSPGNQRPVPGLSEIEPFYDPPSRSTSSRRLRPGPVAEADEGGDGGSLEAMLAATMAPKPPVQREPAELPGSPVGAAGNSATPLELDGPSENPSENPLGAIVALPTPHGEDGFPTSLEAFLAMSDAEAEGVDGLPQSSAASFTRQLQQAMNLDGDEEGQDGEQVKNSFAALEAILSGQAQEQEPEPGPGTSSEPPLVAVASITPAEAIPRPGSGASGSGRGSPAPAPLAPTDNDGDVVLTVQSVSQGDLPTPNMRPSSNGGGSSSGSRSSSRTESRAPPHPPLEAEPSQTRPALGGVLKTGSSKSNRPSEAGTDGGEGTQPANRSGRRIMIVTPSQEPAHMASGLGETENSTRDLGVQKSARFADIPDDEEDHPTTDRGMKASGKGSSGRIRFSDAKGDDDDHHHDDFSTALSRQNSVRSVLKSSSSRKKHAGSGSDSGDDDMHRVASRRASRVNFGADQVAEFVKDPMGGYTPVSRANSTTRGLRFQDDDDDEDGHGIRTERSKGSVRFGHVESNLPDDDDMRVLDRSASQFSVVDSEHSQGSDKSFLGGGWAARFKAWRNRSKDDGSKGGNVQRSGKSNASMSHAPIVRTVSLTDGKAPGLFGSGMSVTGMRSGKSMTKKGTAKRGKKGHAEDMVVSKSQPSMMLMTDPNQIGTTMIGNEEVDDVHYQMMMWNSFAGAWDEIIDDLRQTDHINDKEAAMLKFVRLDLGARSYGLRPILLPTFFYAGQVRKVVDTGQVSTAQIMVLNELRVLCVWLGCQIGLLSGKHAHVLTSAPFMAANVNVKHALYRTKMYNAGLKLVDLLEDMCVRQEVPFDMKAIAEHLFTVLTSLESEAYAVHKAHQRKRATADELELASIMLEVVQGMKKEVSSDADKLKVIFKKALSTGVTADYKELLRVIRVIKRMLTMTVMEATPQSPEARRIISFFINSLAHPSLDKPPSLDKMWSWSVLTPLYEEEVLYPLESEALAKEMGLKKKRLGDLLSETDDSISLMAYLKAMFPQEWSNFKERMANIVPGVDVKDLSEQDFAPGGSMYDYRMEMQMWASLRGQLLARTVNGMMCYERALRVIAKQEHPMPANMSELEYKRYIDQLVNMKFEYVVTPQTFGKNSKSKDLRLRWLAKSMELLAMRYPALKVAFLDEADTELYGPTQFSVCMRGRDINDQNLLPHLDDQPIYELYRVRLPANRLSSRGVILGEGKPENQNHAIIFAHGEGLQAIDMNQDNCLCEALKARNLLMELQPSTKGKFKLFADDNEYEYVTYNTTGVGLHGMIRRRQRGCVMTALVGFREWIFSEKSGALGRFAAATEYAFGTISQRTMTHPARIRLHYGHPDVFNKMFVLTRGGISKGTRLLHLTEDVFCGCNHTLRGGRIRYKEYISCGKGRDMGFDSINGFNFKISGGGGEWAISRESWRMGTRLDFFRLMSFYHSAVGFYVNSLATSIAIYWNIYTLLLFAWAEATEIQADNVERVYNVQQVLQLGTLAMIPYAGQLMLETGLVRMVVTLFQQILTGSLMFYMFQQQTVAMSFQNDMNYGAAKYVSTGRGFNITSMDFVKIYTLYGRTHLYQGFEILFVLTTLYIVRDCGNCNYGLLTWSTWLLAFVFIFAPLWFNPFTFEMSKVVRNFEQWRRWMTGDVDPATGNNWYTWNTANLQGCRNDNGNQTDNWMNVLGVIWNCWPYIIMALAAASRLHISLDISDRYPVLANPYLVCLMGTAAIWLLVYVTILVHARYTDLARLKAWRIYRWVMSLVLLAAIVVFLVVVRTWYTGPGLETILIILYANFNLLIAFHRICTVAFSQNNTIRAFVDSFFYTIDNLVGYIMFILIAILSFIGIVHVLQMKLLFNDTFAQSAQYGKIARAMKDAKVGFDTRSRAASPSASRPASAASMASSWATKSVTAQSERRYM